MTLCCQYQADPTCLSMDAIYQRLQKHFRCDGTVVQYLDLFGKYQEKTKLDSGENNDFNWTGIQVKDELVFCQIQ